MHHHPTRAYPLDLLRFLAALAVVLYHYGFRGAAADQLLDLQFPALATLAQYGYLGVDLFFMISGYVILMSASQSSLFGFFRSRVCRLYPGFWLCLSLTALCMWWLGDERYPVTLWHYLANLTMISGFWQVPPLDGVYWTLLIEIKFYALIALLLALRQLRHIHYYLLAWLLFTLLCPRLTLPPWLELALFPEWSPYFIGGALCYLIRQQGLSPLRLFSLLAALVLALRNAWWRTPGQASYFNTEFSSYWVAALILLFFALMLLLALDQLRRCNWPWLLQLGALTYPLYLLHENIGFILMNRLQGMLPDTLLLLATLALMLLFAFCISRYVEPRGAALLKRLLSRKPDATIAHRKGALSWRQDQA